MCGPPCFVAHIDFIPQHGLQEMLLLFLLQNQKFTFLRVPSTRLVKPTAQALLGLSPADPLAQAVNGLDDLAESGTLGEALWSWEQRATHLDLIPVLSWMLQCWCLSACPGQ